MTFKNGENTSVESRKLNLLVCRSSERAPLGRCSDSCNAKESGNCAYILYYVVCTEEDNSYFRTLVRAFVAYFVEKGNGHRLL